MRPELRMLEIRHTADQSGLLAGYNEIYADHGIRHSDTFYQWILRLLKPEAGKRLLDVACGQGVIPELAAQQGVDAHGFDLSHTALKAATRDDIELIVANGEHIPYRDRTFDYVTNIGSLEHYMNPEAGAREMARVMQPDGTACVLVPNSFSIANMLHAWHNGRTIDDGQPIQRYAARYEWSDLLEANGLVVDKTIKFERLLPRTITDAMAYLRHPKEIAWLLLTPLLPINLANSFVFLCHRTPALS